MPTFSPLPDGCFVEAGDLCGNNLIDEGEACDCGPSRNLNQDGTCINNPCCNGANCTLSSNVDCRYVCVCVCVRVCVRFRSYQ